MIKLPSMADLEKRVYPSNIITAVFLHYAKNGAAINARVCIGIIDKGKLHRNELLNIRKACEKAGVLHLKMKGFFHPTEDKEALEYFKVMAHSGMLAGYY